MILQLILFLSRIVFAFNIEIKKLLTAPGPHPSIKMRILLALGTGLRRGDMDSLKISDIDFEKNSIATTSRKTKKSMASRPVSVEVIAEFSKYVCSLDRFYQSFKWGVRAKVRAKLAPLALVRCSLVFRSSS